MDQYVALSKKDLELSITLNEIYSTHQLLEKHAKELVSFNMAIYSYFVTELSLTDFCGE